LVKEVPNERSFIDLFQLLIIDHPAGQSVAPDQEGAVYTYTDPQPAHRVVDGGGQEVTERVAAADDAYVDYDSGGSITMEFDAPEHAAEHGIRLVLRTDAYDLVQLADNQRSDEQPPGGFSLHLKVRDAEGEWTDLGRDVHPHALWDAWAVDLSDVLPDPFGDYQVQVAWSQYHKVDFIGLDDTLQTTLRVRTLDAQSAEHTRFGSVAEGLRAADDQYIQTRYGDVITVRFPVPDQARAGTRSFIVRSEGYYEGDHAHDAFLAPTLYNLVTGSPYAP
jgi:hypothetical protein